MWWIGERGGGIPATQNAAKQNNKSTDNLEPISGTGDRYGGLGLAEIEMHGAREGEQAHATAHLHPCLAVTRVKLSCGDARVPGMPIW